MSVKVWVGTISALTFVLTLVIIPVIVVRMAPDYFMPDRAYTKSWTRQHPVLRWSTLILKNILGLILLLMGIVMLITPGQGLLTILMGIVLMNFPGKRDLELWFVRQKAILNSINWMRTRANRPELEVPAPRK